MLQSQAAGGDVANVVGDILGESEILTCHNLPKSGQDTYIERAKVDAGITLRLCTQRQIANMHND